MTYNDGQQHRDVFYNALDDLERAVIESTLQTAMWVFAKLDPNTLTQLLDDCQDDVKYILKGAMRKNGFPNPITIESARLALEGLAREHAEKAADAEKARIQHEFSNRRYQMVVTLTRKGKVFFRLTVGGMNLDVWMDFGTKNYLDDWFKESIFVDERGLRMGDLSRSELRGLSDSGVELHPDLIGLMNEKMMEPR